jgi:hypothetical protein
MVHVLKHSSKARLLDTRHLWSVSAGFSFQAALEEVSDVETRASVSIQASRSAFR